MFSASFIVAVASYASLTLGQSTTNCNVARWCPWSNNNGNCQIRTWNCEDCPKEIGTQHVPFENFTLLPFGTVLTPSLQPIRAAPRMNASMAMYVSKASAAISPTCPTTTQLTAYRPQSYSSVALSPRTGTRPYTDLLTSMCRKTCGAAVLSPSR